jgi:hypothetical protein
MASVRVVQKKRRYLNFKFVGILPKNKRRNKRKNSMSTFLLYKHIFGRNLTMSFFSCDLNPNVIAHLPWDDCGRYIAHTRDYNSSPESVYIQHTITTQKNVFLRENTQKNIVASFQKVPWWVLDGLYYVSMFSTNMTSGLFSQPAGSQANQCS